jgi:hypothetical protein
MHKSSHGSFQSPLGHSEEDTEKAGRKRRKEKGGKEREGRKGREGKDGKERKGRKGWEVSQCVHIS